MTLIMAEVQCSMGETLGPDIHVDVHGSIKPTQLYETLSVNPLTVAPQQHPWMSRSVLVLVQLRSTL